MLQARAKIGRTLDITGRTLGVAPRLYAMLLNAGLYEVGYEAFTVDLGTTGGKTAHVYLSEMVRYAFTVKLWLFNRASWKVMSSTCL